MKILALAVLSGILSGCIVAPEPVYSQPEVVITYEPDVIVGAYYIGYYNPGYGYWTGYGWDLNFYAYGHGGYGHYYRGAPRGAWGAYHGGPHFHGAAPRGHVGGFRHH